MIDKPKRNPVIALRKLLLSRQPRCCVIPSTIIGKVNIKRIDKGINSTKSVNIVATNPDKSPTNIAVHLEHNGL
jgi:hypothetical protein